MSISNNFRNSSCDKTSQLQTRTTLQNKTTTGLGRNDSKRNGESTLIGTKSTKMQNFSSLNHNGKSLESSESQKSSSLRSQITELKSSLQSLKLALEEQERRERSKDKLIQELVNKCNNNNNNNNIHLYPTEVTPKISSSNGRRKL